MSIFTHSISTRILSLEHWLFENFYQRMPFKATQNLFRISDIKAGLIYSYRPCIQCISCRLGSSKLWLRRLWLLTAFSRRLSPLSRRLFEFNLIYYSSYGIPDCSITLSQLEELRCIFFFIYSIFLFSEYSHYFINFLKNLILVSLLTHSPSFFITKLQVGALIISVRNAQPEVFSKLTILNFGLRAGLEARISVKAIPTAPLSPP